MLNVGEGKSCFVPPSFLKSKRRGLEFEIRKGRDGIEYRNDELHPSLSIAVFHCLLSSRFIAHTALEDKLKNPLIKLSSIDLIIVPVEIKNHMA